MERLPGRKSSYSLNSFDPVINVASSYKENSMKSRNFGIAFLIVSLAGVVTGVVHANSPDAVAKQRCVVRATYPGGPTYLDCPVPTQPPEQFPEAPSNPRPDTNGEDYPSKDLDPWIMDLNTANYWYSQLYNWLKAMPESDRPNDELQQLEALRLRIVFLKSGGSEQAATATPETQPSDEPNDRSQSCASEKEAVEKAAEHLASAQTEENAAKEAFNQADLAATRLVGERLKLEARLQRMVSQRGKVNPDKVDELEQQIAELEREIEEYYAVRQPAAEQIKHQKYQEWQTASQAVAEATNALEAAKTRLFECQNATAA